MKLMPCRPVRMAVRARKAEREAPRVPEARQVRRGVHRLSGRPAVPSDRLPVRRPPDGAVLGRDEPAGQFLFTVNTASGMISRSSIAPGGALRLLGCTPVRACGGVGEFAVSGGNLTRLTGSRSPGPQAPPPPASSPTNPFTIASRELGSRPRLRGGYRRLLSATTGGVRNDRRRRSDYVPLTVGRSSPSQAATRSRGC